MFADQMIVMNTGWVMEKDPLDHVNRVKDRLSHGREILRDLKEIQAYPLPGVVANDDIHLAVRHGEVHNPARVLYGRLPDYHLSRAGRGMAASAAAHVAQLGDPVAALYASPLERAQESAEPFAERFDLVPEIDIRLIEPTNVFEGTRMRRSLMNPLNWWHLRQPSVPSWGEPYTSIVARMRAAIDDAFESVESGDVVIVSHQLPIWMVHLSVAGERLWHDPRTRRCALSSITSFERVAAEPAEDAAVPSASAPAHRLLEVGYVDAARALLASAKDVGAV